MSVFHFKQFSIKQDETAMKVGTDSILLGAWLKIENKYNKILDVGTGTGLLALMLAQKMPNALTTALEIDQQAYEEAKTNVNASKWKKQINVVLTDARCWESKNKFDLIITNPPYFEKSILSKNESRKKARHQDYFSIEDLVSLWTKHGNHNSELACILPVKESLKMIEIVNEKGFYTKKYVAVKSYAKDREKRALLLFSKQKTKREDSEIYIYASEGEYSDKYIKLTKDFYLNF